jgi:hypothetical protein
MAAARLAMNRRLVNSDMAMVHRRGFGGHQANDRSIETLNDLGLPGKVLVT